MALGAAYVTLNAAAKVFATAWGAFIATLSPGDVVGIVFPQFNINGSALTNADIPTLDPATSDTIANHLVFYYQVPVATSTTTSMLYYIPGLTLPAIPLCFKVTDESGLISIT